jgi:hypothetical protein
MNMQGMRKTQMDFATPMKEDRTMKNLRNLSILLVLLTLHAFNAFGDDAASQGNRGRRHGPPPEAYTACQGKSAGDTAQFVSPRGDTVTGTCEQEGDRLVLRPDSPRRHSDGQGAKDTSE